MAVSGRTRHILFFSDDQVTYLLVSAHCHYYLVPEDPHGSTAKADERTIDSTVFDSEFGGLTRRSEPSP
jgi:hypothetical protein